MTQTNARLVGNSFKLGYRFQRYWDTSMALAFFFAEVGTGLFLVSFYFDFIPGMIAGLAVVSTLKPYFHLAHMGVPSRSWRAFLRPDRSWISRGALAIGVLIGFGVLYLIDLGFGVVVRFGLPAFTGELLGYLSVAGALTVMCYQGMAMSDSESFTLWASALLPVSSFLYALTAGVLTMLVIGWNALGGDERILLSILRWRYSLSSSSLSAPSSCEPGASQRAVSFPLSCSLGASAPATSSAWYSSSASSCRWGFSLWGRVGG